MFFGRKDCCFDNPAFFPPTAWKILADFSKRTEKPSFLTEEIFVRMFFWTRRMYLTKLPNKFRQKAENFLFSVWEGKEKFLFFWEKLFCQIFPMAR